MSKILIITGQFAPYTKSLGGILRVYSFLKLLKKKHKIFLVASKCVTNTNYGYLGLIKKNLKDVDINYINNNDSTFISSILNYRLFRNLFYLLGIDYASNIHANYLKKSYDLIEKNKIDYLVISSPPFSLFYLVKKIRYKFKNIKIILDYRDGWSTRINNIHNLPIKFLIKKFIESKILSQSNFVIAATSNIYKKLKNLNVYKTKFFLIRNGYLFKPKIKKKKNKKIKIGYFGLVSDDSTSYRNIRVIFDVIKKSKLLQKKFIFEFYGNNDIQDMEIKNFKLFNFKNNLNFKRALSKMTEMDYLLILHTEKSTSREMVTSKFYDYLASRTPIINVSHGKNEVGKMIKKMKLGHNIDYEKDDLEFFFMKLKKISKKTKWNKNFNYLSRNHQNKKLLKIIN
ncbi:hypothetical protein N9S53_00575 [Candidatus Pelagibacter sp.]|nr:hypothetical protein [Candidatus Pelagibacter sp.]